MYSAEQRVVHSRDTYWGFVSDAVKALPRSPGTYLHSRQASASFWDTFLLSLSGHQSALGLPLQLGGNVENEQMGTPASSVPRQDTSEAHVQD